MPTAPRLVDLTRTPTSYTVWRLTTVLAGAPLFYLNAILWVSSLLQLYVTTAWNSVCPERKRPNSGRANGTILHIYNSQSDFCTGHQTCFCLLHFRHPLWYTNRQSQHTTIDFLMNFKPAKRSGSPRGHNQLSIIKPLRQNYLYTSKKTVRRKKSHSFTYHKIPDVI